MGSQNQSLMVVSNGFLNNANTYLSAVTNDLLSVSGSGSSWVIGGISGTSGNLVIGGVGNSLQISNGGFVSDYYALVGADPDPSPGSPASNSIVITGNGSLWSNNQSVTIGSIGSFNALQILQGGMMFADSVTLGSSSNSILVQGNGSVMNVNGALSIGTNGVGNSLQITNGGAVFSGSGVIGAISTPSASNTVVVSGTGSMWSNNLGLVLGDVSPGNRLQIENAGSAYSQFGIVGNSSSSTGNIVSIDGGNALANPLWSNATSLIIGNSGSGTLTVANSGAVIAGDGIVIAADSQSVGTLNVGSLLGNDAAGSIISPYIIFGSGTGTINFNQTNATTITNIISGSGSLNQNGTGTTILAAANSYYGPTSINNGMLQILAGSSIFSGTNDIYVNNGAIFFNDGIVQGNTVVNGLLQGTGTFIGNVTVAGTIFPGDDPGTITVQNGNLTLMSAARWVEEVASPSNYSVIQVLGGSASLSGTLSMVSFNGFLPSFGDQYSFLQASGGISGSFETILMPSGYRGRLLLENNLTTGTLLVAPASYTQVATGGNQLNVSRALDSFVQLSPNFSILGTNGAVQSNNDMLVVATALDELSLSQYPQAFNAIMPTFYQQVATIAFNEANALNMELNQRLWGLRLAEGGGFSMSGLADNYPMLQEGQGDGSGKGVLDAKKDILRPGLDNHWGLFVDGNGIFAQANSANMLPGYNSESGGITTGLTYKWNDKVASGIYAGYQGTYTKSGANGSGLGTGSSLTDNAVRFGVFGTYGQKDGKGLYLNALAGGAYHNYQATRVIQFSGLNRSANSQPGAGELDTMLATGYDIQKGHFTFGPTASLQYTYLGVNSLNETGAQSLNYNSSGWNSSSMLSSVGAHAAYNWVAHHGSGGDIVVVPQINLSWQHEFLQNPYAINGTLGGTSPTFSNWSSTPIRDFLYTGVGVTVDIGKRWNTSFFYNAAAGNQNLTSQNIFWSAGVKF
jgi:autotransporter-associated beta strand protein/T5SS/PEP-CTERM-associated repeat protein